jgi:exosortase
MDAPDGLAKQGSDADHLDFGPLRLWDGVGGDDFLNGGIPDPLVGEFAEDGVGNSGVNAFRTVLVEDIRRSGEGAGRFCHVIDKQDIATLDLADHVHRLYAGGADTVLGDDCEFRSEGVRVGAGHFHPSHIGGNDREVRGVRVTFAKVADQHGFRVKVVHRDVEESLDLWCVEIHREDPVHSGGGEQVCDQLCGDRYPRLVLPVLPCVAEKWNHGGDALGARAAGGIHHDEELHQVVVRRRAARLDDEHVGITDVFVDFHLGFPVGKCGDMDVGKRLAKVFRDTFGKGAVSGSTDDFHEKMGAKSSKAGGLLTARRRSAILCSENVQSHSLTSTQPSGPATDRPQNSSGIPVNSVQWGPLVVSVFLLVWFFGFESRYGDGRGLSPFVWIWWAWNPETGYEHGPLFPLVIAGLIFFQFKSLRNGVGEGSLWGLGVVLFGALIYAAGYRTLQPRVAMGALPFLLWGSALALWGWQVARLVLFPLFFFWLAIPLPGFQQATTQLQLLATSMAHHGASLFGVQTVVQGNQISSVHGGWAPLEIAAGCSGIRSLMALLMISGAWAYIAKMALWKRVLLFLSAFPLAIIGNSLRVISIFVIGEYGNAHWSRTTWHDWSGLLLFYPISLMMLLGIHSMLEGGFPWRRKNKRQLRRVNVTRSDSAGESKSFVSES